MMPSSAAELSKPGPGGRPVFTGSARWAAAVVLLAGPLLQAVEFLLGKDTGDNAARVACWAAHLARAGLAMASGLLALPFLLGASAVLVALTRASSLRLAWLGGAFMAFAMVGLAAVHGYELAAYGPAQAGEATSAAAVLNGDQLGLPGAVLLVMFLGGAVLGTVTLAVAAWRSSLVPRIVPVFMLAFAALDFAAGLGVVSHLVNLVGFAILAAAAGAVAMGVAQQRLLGRRTTNSFRQLHSACATLAE